MRSAYNRFIWLENAIHRELVNHSVAALRVAVGLVFFGFGILKYFPGVSPAEGLAIRTTDILSFGLVPGGVAIVGIATLECFIGLCLLAGRWMRVAIWLLALEFVGVLSPVVLLTSRLFAGPHHAPTLEGQYVLKDIILVAAGMVIAAATFRGGRLVRDEPSADPSAVATVASLNSDQKLEIALAGMHADQSVTELLRRPRDLRGRLLPLARHGHRGRDAEPGPVRRAALRRRPAGRSTPRPGGRVPGPSGRPCPGAGVDGLRIKWLGLLPIY